MKVILFVSLVAAVAQAEDSKTLLKIPSWTKWIENDDPIMGGKSKGNFSIVDTSFGRFQGSVRNVPFLHAPGFCRMMTVTPLLVDASEFLDGGILLTIRSTTPDFKGFRFSFGSLRAPKHHGGHEIEGSYKANLKVPASKNGEWQSVFLKFTDFSADWSDYSGDCHTKDPDGYQHQCCTPETKEWCPDEVRLRGINSFNVWAEGSEGNFELDIKEIKAARGASDQASPILV
eukprot:TRINITY_DN1452_c0_g2_i5.p1 TRINITY_DN1452_c0_g2~~TRINITY_DN1452_c0_g2_i5.p1  ORF type:complete len:231 (+),score=43.90 TRINITY_DN1452_c0_g2_i5:85-777(+)